MRSRGASTDPSVAPIRRLECVNRCDFDTGLAAQAEDCATSLPRPLTADRASTARIRVGLIDSLRARRDYLVEMLARTHPDLDVVSFVDVATCVEPPTLDFDVILYCSSDDRWSVCSILDDVDLLRKTFADVPVVLLPLLGASALRSELSKAFNTMALRPP